MSIKAKCREGSICIRCTECVAMEFNFVASVRTFKTESTCSGRTSSVGKPLPPLPRVARTPSTSEGASELPRRGAATGSLPHPQRLGLACRQTSEKFPGLESMLPGSTANLAL